MSTNSKSLESATLTSRYGLLLLLLKTPRLLRLSNDAPYIKHPLRRHRLSYLFLGPDLMTKKRSYIKYLRQPPKASASSNSDDEIPVVSGIRVSPRSPLVRHTILTLGSSLATATCTSPLKPATYKNGAYHLLSPPLTSYVLLCNLSSIQVSLTPSRISNRVPMLSLSTSMIAMPRMPGTTSTEKTWVASR